MTKKWASSTTGKKRLARTRQTQTAQETQNYWQNDWHAHDKRNMYNVEIHDDCKELVIDFFKIDFRKKDADYQKKMIILNHNARHGNK